MTDPARDLPRRLLEIANWLEQFTGDRRAMHAATCRAAAQSLTDTEAAMQNMAATFRISAEGLQHKLVDTQVELAKEREAHRYTAQALVEACAARDAKDEVIATLRAALAESEAVTLRQSASIAELLEAQPATDREARRAGQKEDEQ